VRTREVPCSSLLYVPARLRNPTHLLKIPSLGIATSLEVVRVSMPCLHRPEPVSGAFPADRQLHLLEIGFQAVKSFHIARVTQRVAPYAWTRPLVCCHAVDPISLSAPGQSSGPGTSSKFLPLRWEYGKAPRGAERADRGRPRLHSGGHPVAVCPSARDDRSSVPTVVRCCDNRRHVDVGHRCLRQPRQASAMTHR
jgi:hypothetical protein